MSDTKGSYVAQIGSRLRLARVQAGMTLRQAEEETGLSKDTISRIERGLRNPQPLTTAKLAEAYGQSIEEFLEAPKAPAPQPPNSAEERGSSVLGEILVNTADEWIRNVAMAQSSEEAFRFVREAQDLEERLNSYVADPDVFGRLPFQEKRYIARVTTRLDKVEVLYRRKHIDDPLQRDALEAELARLDAKIRNESKTQAKA